jgi:hypothetical protein
VNVFVVEDKTKEAHSASTHCGDTFEERGNIKNYQQKKHKDTYKQMMIIEREPHLHRINLAFHLMQLKEKEDSARGMSMCNTFRRIFHKKHNWHRSSSHECVTRFTRSPVMLATCVTKHLLVTGLFLRRS